MQFDSDAKKTIINFTAVAKSALKFTGHQRDPELALTVQKGGKLPVSLQQTMFKKIDVSINIKALLTKCIQFARPDSQRDIWVVAEQMPVFSLLGLLTIPFAIKAIRGALKHQDMSKLVPAMANNVLVVLLTQLFMGIGYILARVF